VNWPSSELLCCLLLCGRVRPAASAAGGHHRHAVEEAFSRAVGWPASGGVRGGSLRPRTAMRCRRAALEAVSTGGANGGYEPTAPATLMGKPRTWQGPLLLGFARRDRVLVTEPAGDGPAIPASGIPRAPGRGGAGRRNDHEPAVDRLALRKNGDDTSRRPLRSSRSGVGPPSSWTVSPPGRADLFGEPALRGRLHGGRTDCGPPRSSSAGRRCCSRGCPRVGVPRPVAPARLPAHENKSDRWGPGGLFADDDKYCAGRP